MGLIKLVLRFLRLGPLGLGLIACVIMGAGYYLQVLDNERAADRARILAEGPPASVDIAQFDPDIHKNALGEVVVQAQPVLESAYRFTIEKDGADDHVFMIPLVSPISRSETDIIGIAYFRSDSDAFSNITPELLMRGTTGFGQVGPIVDYNGDVGSMGQWDDLTREAFVEQGLQMPANLVVVWPYAEGRAVAFAPRHPGDWTIFGVFSKIAGAIGLLALAKLVMRPAKRDDEGVQEAPIPQQAAQAVYQPPAAPEYEDPAPTAVVDDAELLGRRSGFSVRKLLVAIVGLAFAVLLGGILFGMTDKTAATTQVAAAPTQQEVMASTVADLAVPDADPNRHWTDIDVTPIIEWFVAKGLLALSGDLDAIKLLAMIAGGVLLAPMLLWYFFRLRRSLAPKTTARIDAMGIN